MSDRILDIKLTYRCNNNCNYCCQDRQLRSIDSDLNINAVRKILEKENNVTKVVLTGGEATLLPELVDIIKLIKAAGIKNIQLQSNAKKLAEKDYLFQIINAGVNAFGISLHGCSQSMHEAFTGTEGSFDAVINALENLKEYSLPVALNCVITKHNVNQLKEIVDFIDDNHYAQSVQFAFIHITGKAENGIDDYVKISAAASQVRSMLQNNMKKIGIFTEAIPFCLMEGFEKNVSELRSKGEIVTYDFRERRDFSESIEKIFKCKSPLCHKCLFYSMCEGIWTEYPQIYGFDEFKPVTDFRSEY